MIIKASNMNFVEVLATRTRLERARGGVKVVGKLVGNADWLFEKLKVGAMDLRDLDVSEVTSMRGLFQGCKNLEVLDVTGWDTSKVTDMHGMFSYCPSLEWLDGVKDFNTSKVTDMSSMFDGCKSIRTLDLAGWDTSKVTNMRFMFAECGRTHADILAEDPLSLAAMFAAPRSKLEVSNWDTSSVTDMYGIFQNAWFWEDPDISRWDMSHVEPENTAWSDGTYIRE